MIPSSAQVKNLQKILNQSLILKLYSNDVVPALTDSVSSYDEVIGGGYAIVPLIYANWVITEASGVVPTRATYPMFDMVFTGPLTAPNTIYGYYIIDADGVLFGAERFSESIVPFSTKLNSLIRITPRYIGG